MWLEVGDWSREQGDLKSLNAAANKCVQQVERKDKKEQERVQRAVVRALAEKAEAAAAIETPSAEQERMIEKRIDRPLSKPL